MKIDLSNKNLYDLITTNNENINNNDVKYENINNTNIKINENNVDNKTDKNCFTKLQKIILLIIVLLIIIFIVYKIMNK